MIVGTKKDFERLADFVLQDYLGNAYDNYRPLDIQKFAKEYLNLNVSYYDFDYESGIEGLISGNQIVLDSFLEHNKKTGERNFTIAHECGHRLVNLQDPDYKPSNETFYRRRGDSHKVLKTEHDFREWQANVVGTCLLLRPNLVGWSMFTFTQKEKIPYFEYLNYYPMDRERLKNMAKFLGVSLECLTYRLDELGYLDHKTMDEYDSCENIYFPIWR